MELFSKVRRVLRLGFWPRELDDELDFHFARTVEALTDSGMARREAEEEAHRRFGDERRYRTELARIDGAFARRRRWAERAAVLGGSLGLSLRRIRRSPGFAGAVVLTFALGIGANATMYGIVDRLLLRAPAHIAGPERVKRLWISRTDPFSGTRAAAEV